MIHPVQIPPYLKSILSILLIVSMFVFDAIGQASLSTKDTKAAKSYRRAVELYGQKLYQQADNALKDAINRDKNFVEAWLLLGDLKMDQRDQQGAIIAYEQAIGIDPAFYPRAILVLANLFRSNGQYEDGLKRYEQFLLSEGSRPADRQVAEAGLASCQFALAALADPVSFDPQNIGKEVNGPYDEFVNAISTDRSLLLFTRKHPSGAMYPDGRPQLVEDFFMAKQRDGIYIQARPLGPPINTDGNEGALSISADDRYLFFAGCGRRDGLGSCDIYYSVRDGNTWKAPYNPGPPLNSSRWDSHPSLSADNRTLFFASTRGGGLGKSDLWMATVGADGRWNEPVNLGDSINTPGQEMSPLIHPDGQTLYFSSDGHPGMGGMDLFVSRKREDGKWGKPVNLGYPINTLADELALIVDAAGEWAYFSSDKLGGSGGYDIYRFELQAESRPVPVTYMKGKVFDAESKIPLKASFEIIDLASGQIVVIAGSDPVSGEFLVCIPTGKSYGLNVSAANYLFYSENFPLQQSAGIHDPVLKDVALSPIKEGQAVVMRNVFFETASYELRPESQTELDRLVQLLNDNPGIYIEIGGHTDNVGTASYNLQLSERRANAVMHYLVNKGISAGRLSAVGYGLTQPIAANDTEEGRALNRRTAFTVTKSIP